MGQKLKEREDFYRASKEVMQEVNLATRVLLESSTSMQEDWLLLWDLRRMYEMTPPWYQLPVTHSTLSFLVSKLGTEVKFAK